MRTKIEALYDSTLDIPDETVVNDIRETIIEVRDLEQKKHLYGGRLLSGYQARIDECKEFIQDLQELLEYRKKRRSGIDKSKILD